jgi:predicted RNA-binding Zn ribbon-like protein
MTGTRHDPRPLIGEPLSIDLLNTRWNDAGVTRDLLDTVAGLTTWLDSPTVREALREHPVAHPDQAVLHHTRAARAAIAAVFDSPDDPAAVAALNEVLAHGRVRRRLGAAGPETSVEVDDPTRYVGWTAAADYLRLLADRPTRIRPCANPACILHFYDISKNGTRRWCSMSGCGNRAKASRHYARQPRP